MSSKAKSKKHEDVIRPGLLFFMRLLAVAALLLSGYLAYVSLSSSAVAGCGPDSSCDRVLHSRWGYWFGLPVSIPAFALYAALITFLWRLNPKSPIETQRKAWHALFPAAIVILGAALWFIGVQMFIIKSFCPWCMTTHTVGAILAMLLLSNAPVRQAPDKNWQAEKSVFIPPSFTKKLGGFAALGLAILIAGQFLHSRKLYEVQSVAGNLTAPDSNATASAATPAAATYTTPREAQTNPAPQTNPAVANTANPSPANQAAPPDPLQGISRPGLGPNAKAFEFYQGRFVLDLYEVPLIGSPTAPKAMVSLFDYTCHHCRETHPVIMETHKAFGDQLAIVSLPMPLDSKCNYTVRRTPRSHAHACEYAQLGLAVWHANRKVHQQYDDFIFTPAEPPPIESARQYAAQLVGGPANLEKALSDGWVNQYLKLGIDIYATNYIHVGNGSMPQIIVGSRLATGTITPDKLKATITEQLGLQPRQ